MEKVEYASPKQIVEREEYPFTIGQLRYYLMHRHKNGLAAAVRKIGKILVIRIDLFNEWIEKQALRG